MKQWQYYEKIAESLKGFEKEKALRAAQNHLEPQDKYYWVHCKRLQNKIIKACEEQIN